MTWTQKQYHFMKHFNISRILLVSLVMGTLTFSSCKKVAKEASEKAAKELSEESAEAATKKAGKMSLREIGEKTVKKIDFDDFIKLLEKEYPATHTSFSMLDKDFQHSIFSEMQKHSDFFENVISSRTLLDKYVVFTKDAPKLANNVSMLRYIASNEGAMEQMLVKQSGNVVSLFQKGTNKLLGKYHDGVIEVVEPFAKDGRTFESSLLRSDMIPNTLYKVRGKMGLNYLIQSDDLGRTMTVQASKLDPDDIITNVLRRNQDLNLGNEWLDALKKIKQSSKGDDIDLKVAYKYADNKLSPKSVKITALVNSKPCVEQNFINLNQITTNRMSAGKKAIAANVRKTVTRILVTSKNQFITSKRYVQWLKSNPNSIVKTGIKDANVLRENMYKVMGKSAKYAKKTAINGNQAHHIIGNKTPIAANKLKKFGIDINDPMNGVFLPSSNRSGLKGTIHRGGHTEDYYQYIEQMFTNCKSQEDCYQVLDKIKDDLYKGKIKLYSDDKHQVNKILKTTKAA